MSKEIHIDFEARSACDIQKKGAYNYAKHPSTEVLCLAYAVDDGRVEISYPAFPAAGIPARNWPPKDLFELIKDRKNTVHAHNAFFERVMWRYVCHERLGWPAVEDHQWRCTLSIASYHALPRRLKEVAIALGLPSRKDMEGNKIMLKCSKPDSNGNWHEDRQDLITTFKYCQQDVVVERRAEKHLGPLPPFELAIWQLDQKINETGIPFDVEMAKQAVNAIGQAKAEANLKIYELTGGEVETTTAIKTWEAWTKKQGYSMKGVSLAADLIPEHLANPDIPEIIKEAIRIKKSAAMSSVNKYKTVLDLVSLEDSRIRDGLYYFGAGTGRYAGRGVQIQNFPKGYGDKNPYTKESEPPFMDEMCESIANGNFGWGKIFTGEDTFTQLRNATRGVIKAPPGKEFLIVDYSAIEARVLMWLVDDKEAIAVLNESCIYCDMASTLYGFKVIKSKHPGERQFGKQAILGCFSKDTRVYTDSGLKAIVDVLPTDKVWDGHKWVSHEGVIYQGWKKTVKQFGIEATPDHPIFTSNFQTVKFQELSENSQYLTLAINQGYSGLKAMLSESEAELNTYGYLAGVTGTKFTKSLQPISKGGDRPGATSVLKKRLKRRHTKNTIGNTRTSCPITGIEHGFLTGLAHAYQGVITLKTNIIATMGREVLRFTGLGGQTAASSWNTSSLSLAGTTLSSNLTGPMSIGGMSLGTCVSLQRPKTCRIREESKTSKRESESWNHVYDIASAGPQNRFLIHTEAGPMLVHNCGYSMGYVKFFDTLQSYNIEIPEETANRLLGSDKQAYVNAVIRDRVKIAKAGIDIATHKLSLAACKKIVEVYRAKYPLITKFWSDVEAGAKKAVKNPGVEVPVARVSWFYNEAKDFLEMRLPSGRNIHYHKPIIKKQYAITVEGLDSNGKKFRITKDRLKEITGQEVPLIEKKLHEKGLSLNQDKDPWIRESEILTYMKPDKGKAVVTDTYGGKLTENACQAIARDFMCNAMLESDKRGYNIIMTVHDEIVAEENEGEKDLGEFEKVLCILPDWAPDAPIGVEGFKAKRYRK